MFRRGGRYVQERRAREVCSGEEGGMFRRGGKFLSLESPCDPPSIYRPKKQQFLNRAFSF